MIVNSNVFLGCWSDKSLQVGSCGSGVEPVSYYWEVAGLIPPVCMSKCPWARYWPPKLLLRCWSLNTLNISHCHQWGNNCPKRHTVIHTLLFKINIVIGKNNPRLLQHITHNSSQRPLLHVILSLVMFPVCREAKNVPQNYFWKINVPINGTADAFPVKRKSLKSPILNISKLEDLVERDNMLFYKLPKKKVSKLLCATRCDTETATTALAILAYLVFSVKCESADSPYSTRL